VQFAGNVREVISSKTRAVPGVKNSRQSDVEFKHCLYKVIWEERVDRTNQIRWPRIVLILNTHGEERHEEHKFRIRVLRLV
jgi:hypothetical protein